MSAMAYQRHVSAVLSNPPPFLYKCVFDAVTFGSDIDSYDCNFRLREIFNLLVTRWCCCYPVVRLGGLWEGLGP